MPAGRHPTAAGLHGPLSGSVPDGVSSEQGPRPQGRGADREDRPEVVPRGAVRGRFGGRSGRAGLDARDPPGDRTPAIGCAGRTVRWEVEVGGASGRGVRRGDTDRRGAPSWTIQWP